MFGFINLSLFFIGVFIARGKEDALVTKNMVPGEAVYGEKRISVEVNVLLSCYGVVDVVVIVLVSIYV